jgi:hypothetical protein
MTGAGLPREAGYFHPFTPLFRAPICLLPTRLPPAIPVRPERSEVKGLSRRAPLRLRPCGPTLRANGLAEAEDETQAARAYEPTLKTNGLVKLNLNQPVSPQGARMAGRLG